jgi:hypothetical protein
MNILLVIHRSIPSSATGFNLVTDVNTEEDHIIPTSTPNISPTESLTVITWNWRSYEIYQSTGSIPLHVYVLIAERILPSYYPAPYGQETNWVQCLSNCSGPFTFRTTNH